MHPMMNIAINAARQAGRIIVQHLDRMDRITTFQKGPRDFVTEVDQIAEQEIIRVIHQAYPDHAILAEESGTINEHSHTWIIDPLDGTTNFIHGYPQFCVSIALQLANRIEIAVVYDPIQNELFTASRGKGAQLNNRRIRVTRCDKIADALIATGFPVRYPELMADYMASFLQIMPNCAGIRRSGSAALDLCNVAAGRLDGYWEMALKPWDIAAGMLLVTEAGGMISDFNGKMDMLKSGNVIASTPRMHDHLYKIIRNS